LIEIAEEGIAGLSFLGGRTRGVGDGRLFVRAEDGVLKADGADAGGGRGGVVGRDAPEL
jgi:hypothetical protein